MSFSLFPVDLMKHDLSGLELRVLVALYSFRSKNTDIVWPSLEKLSDVSGIPDITTVSKITTRLAEKGLLSKKKRGFTGGNEYHLIVPEYTPLSNLDKTSNLEKLSNSNLDKTSNSNLDKTSKNKEQTKEQTNEHNNKRTKEDFGVSLLSEIPDLPDQVAKDFLSVRKAKKSPLTETALKGIAKEAAMAGLTTAEAITISVERGWQSFKASWVYNKAQPADDFLARHTDRSWADGL